MTSPTSSPVGGNRLTLAVSFSGPGGSLALGGPGWTEDVDWGERATASELATSKLTELLDRRGLALDRVTEVIVNVGPGSFTGIRVGVNLARTLAYALDRPIAAVDTLSVLAVKHLGVAESALIALKAVRNHYYVAGFTRGTDDLGVTLPPCSRPLDELDRATKVLVEGEDFAPRASATDLLRLAREVPTHVRFSSWAAVTPLYVRGSEAEEKLKKGLLQLP